MIDSDDKRDDSSTDRPEGEGRESAFRVIDRRRFSADGEERIADSTSTGPAGFSAPPPPPKAESMSENPGFVLRDQPASSDHEPVPEANMSALFLGLSTQALLHLGEIPDAESGKPERDLPAARGLIDLLAVLRDKTRGNLDAEEAHLLDRILYDLRMRFVEIARS